MLEDGLKTTTHQLVEGLLRSHLGGCAPGVLHEGATLLGHHRDAPDLTERVEVVAEVLLRDGLVEAADVERRDVRVFGRVERGQCGGPVRESIRSYLMGLTEIVTVTTYTAVSSEAWAKLREWAVLAG